MSQTHYDDYINDENNTELLEIVDKTLRIVERTPTLQAKHIDYILFKHINSEYFNDKEGYDDTLWQLLYHIFCFKRSGQKVYELAPSLCDRFLATHIKKVPTELLQMPYSSILLKIPRGALVREWANVERTTFVSDIYIHEGEHTDHTRMLKLFVVYRDKGDEQRCINMNFNIFLSEPTVEECVAKSKDIINKYFDDGVYQKEGVQCDKPTQEDLQMLEKVFSFVMKSVLYIVGAEADIVYEDRSAPLFQKLQRVKSSGKRKEIERRIAQAGIPRYKVGSRIVLSRGEKVIYEGIRQGKWTLSYRLCVAGHYKAQPYGEGRQLRKVIFIKPYEKGPELADTINKDHYVK